MSEDQRRYDSLQDYRKDILCLVKDYFILYLNRIRQGQEETSVNRHLYQETLLRSEVENFLAAADRGQPAEMERNIEAFEALIEEKAMKSMEAGLFLPLEYLCRIFGLDRFERWCVTVLSACLTQPEFEKVYAYLGNDWRVNTLSAGLALQLYPGPENAGEAMFSYFLRSSRLCRHFIALEKNGGEIGFKARLRLKPGMEAFLTGGSWSDGGGCGLTYYVPGEELKPLLAQDKPYLHMLRYIPENRRDKTSLFYLYGIRGIGKKLNIKYLGKELNRTVIFLEPERLEAFGGDTPALLQNVITEAILKQGLLCICSTSQNPAGEEKLQGLVHSILSIAGEELPVLFVTSDSPKKMNINMQNADVIAIEAAAGTPEENHRFWAELSKGYHFEPGVRLEDFANRFMMTPGQIEEIYEEAERLSRWYGQDRIRLQLLQKICFEKLEHNLGEKALKVKLLYQWEDLILPEYQKNMLKMACDQVRFRYKVFSEWGFDKKMAYGTGLSLIFSGSPGTGKTMAAQVLAGELGLELFKIELACVVSKYIGETERNLNEIFEEAKKSQAIIFFDEADVLFGKRSEVKDSNDKYSNMEAAFMLQKIEEYTGIVILATNYQQNIDEAFKRRIKFLIDFPFPDPPHRKRIWLRAFPDKLPLSGDVDFDFLADKFELSGSNIKNIALNAAFLAASEDAVPGMPHIIRAVVNEFTKSGKKLSKEDMGEYFMYV